MASEREELELLRQQQADQDDRAELEFLRNQQGDLSPTGSTLKEMNREPGNFEGTFSQFALRNFVDNMLNVPNAIGELAGQGLAGATAGVRTLGENIGVLPGNNTLGENFAIAKNTPPASTLIGGMNVPDTFDLQAGLSATPQAMGNFGLDLMRSNARATTPGDALLAQQLEMLRAEAPSAGEVFTEARGVALNDAIARREAEPFAAGSGEVAGDVGSNLLIRLPLAKATRNERILNPIKAPKKVIPPSFKQTVDDVVNSKIVQSMKRGGIHVAETGLEGAMIAALNDEDPLASAALSAGSQAMGSLALSGSRGLLGNKGANFVVAAATTMGFIQLFKESTPGGRDRILESAESSYEKIAALMALGGLATVAGMGRSGQRISNQIPVFADSVTSIPRASMVSILSDFADDSEGRIEQVLTQVIEDPQFFGPTAQRRLERAILDKDISIKDTIDNLMIDRGFRRKLNALQEQ